MQVREGRRDFCLSAWRSLRQLLFPLKVATFVNYMAISVTVSQLNALDLSLTKLRHSAYIFQNPIDIYGALIIFSKHIMGLFYDQLPFIIYT